MNYMADHIDQDESALEPRRNPDILGQETAERILAEGFLCPLGSFLSHYVVKKKATLTHPPSFGKVLAIRC